MSMTDLDYLLFDAVDDEKASTAELLFTLADNAGSADSSNVTTTPAASAVPATTEETSKPLTENPEVLKGVQDDLQELDVFVCGLCHSVFHFVEQFQEHRAKTQCRGTSTFKASLSESKPHVWAFLLWKNAQTKILGDTESSWKLYQRWCKMSDDLRETWIAAGKDLQANCMMVSHLRLEAANKNGKSKTSSIYSILEDDDDIRLRPYRRHESYQKWGAGAPLAAAYPPGGRRALTIRRLEANSGGGGSTPPHLSPYGRVTSNIASPIDEAQFNANIDALYKS